jgi:ferredoxin
MKLTLDRKACLKSGQCTYLHPALFEEGPDGYPVVLHEDVPPELEQEAEDAVEICPSQAIVVEQ